MKQKKRFTTKQKRAIFKTAEAYVAHCEEKRQKAEEERKGLAEELNEEFQNKS